MTQKDDKRKTWNMKGAEDHNKSQKTSRRMLASIDAPERMKVNCIEAKLHKYVCSDPHYDSREFASYCRGSVQYAERSYSINSNSKRPTPKKRSTLSAYPPELQAFPWCPETIDANCELIKHSCHCKKCTSERCPSKASQLIKDNIARFKDESTMTNMVDDACCGGYTPVLQSPCCSDDAVTTSYTKLRHRKVANCSSKCSHHRIKAQSEKPREVQRVSCDKQCTRLRKGWECPIRNYGRPLLISDRIDYVAHNDTDRMCEIPKRCRSLRTCMKPNREESVGRRNLYNEGISDTVITGKSQRPHVTPPSRSPCQSRPCSRMPSPCRSEREDSSETFIPYAHRFHSRYHRNCKFPFSDLRGLPTEHCPVPNSNNMFCRMNNYCKQRHWCWSERARQPRRVLTSERDMASLLDRPLPSGSRARRRCFI